MIPRERVLAALRHEETDRVPVDFWVVPEVLEKLKAHFCTTSEEEVLRKLKIDIRNIVPDYIGPKMPVLDDGSFFEPMGTHRKTVKNQYGSYDEYASFPLASAESLADLERYNWPKPEWWDIDGFSDKIGSLNETYYIKLETGGLFERAWALRGYEQYLMDMILDPEIPHGIMEHLTGFYCEYLERILEKAGNKIDAIYTYDDIAAQNGLLISPQMWEEFVQPYHKKLNKVIKSFGKTIIYHSCGSVRPMIGKLADLPIDVLNPLQPRAKDMDFQAIKDEWGARLCFHGGIDIQHTLPKGTVEDVCNEVKRAVSILGKGGGYILTSAHYIQADTPLENIFAMYEAVDQITKGEL